MLDTTHPRRTALEILLAAAIVLSFAAIYWLSVSGDASIYFVYFKNFFHLPFEYQPNTVSFGATSPLHVLIHAPIHAALGEGRWLPVSKALNAAFVVAGMVLLNRAIRGNAVTLLAIGLLTVMQRDLFITTAQLYETGLAYLAMAWLYVAFARNQSRVVALLCGLLYLVRPELALVSISAGMLLLWRLRGQTRALLLLALLAALPVIIYHGYMVAMTGELLPSSVTARASLSTELGLGYVDSLIASLRSVAKSSLLVYALVALCVLWIAVRGRLAHYAVELALLLPVVMLYVAMPPQSYLARYLLPIAPIAAVLPVKLAMTWQWRARMARMATVALVAFLVVFWGYEQRYEPAAGYDYDTLLLHDLAQQLNPLTHDGDRAMIYEIQGQYYLDAHTLSLDGIVGDDLREVLAHQVSFEDYLSAHDEVRFVVTMNGFTYRALYDDTLLEDIYSHDLQSEVGASLHVGALTFSKILTNPAFADPARYVEVPAPNLNVGDTLRVYPPDHALWAGSSLFWNSVYEIER